MKKILYMALGLTILFSSCKKDDSQSNSSTELGGETDIAINTVGNKFASLGTNVNGTYVDIPSSIEIINSSNGVNTIRITADLTQTPELAVFNEIIPSDLKDDQGRINFETKVKITSEGWLDYSNTDNAPLVAVKFDCSVGDQYSFTKKNGEVVTRTVTQKSTTDDYPYGFLNIKVIKVEQETNVPGLKKYVARFNHKFGLVAIDIVAEDGSVLSSQFSADSY